VNPRALLRSACAFALLSVAIATARADVVVVVAANSPIRNLTTAEIADIYLGRLTRLPDGTRPIPIDRPEDSPLREELYEKVARLSPVQVKAHWSRLIFTGRGRPPRAVASDEAVLRILRENPAAIGYIDRRSATEAVRILD